MGAITSQITSITIVYSTVYSDADQRNHQSSASLAFVWGIHRGPVNSPHKWPVTRKMFPFDDVIMLCVESIVGQDIKQTPEWLVNRDTFNPCDVTVMTQGFMELIMMYCSQTQPSLVNKWLFLSKWLTMKTSKWHLDSWVTVVTEVLETMSCYVKSVVLLAKVNSNRKTCTNIIILSRNNADAQQNIRNFTDDIFKWIFKRKCLYFDLNFTVACSWGQKVGIGSGNCFVPNMRRT